MSDLVEYAEAQLAAIGMGVDAEEWEDRRMHDCIIEIVSKFAEQNHSGASSVYCASILGKLLRGLPIGGGR